MAEPTRRRSLRRPSLRLPSTWGWATILVVAAMVAPVVLDRDSHPLSTYPMYSSARGRAVTLPAAIGTTGEGDEVRLGMQTVGMSDDPLIVAGELRAAIRSGRADERCAEIARRVDDASIITVVVAMERHDVVARVEGDESLLERTVQAECPTGAP